MDIDIGIVLTGIAGVLGAIAVLVGAFKKKNGDNGKDTPTERTLDGAFELIGKIQKERDRAGILLDEAEQRCTKRVEALEAKVEIKVTRLETKIQELEKELREAYKK